MNYSIATVFKELYTPFLQTGIIQKAITKQLISFDIHSFFEYVDQKERIDAPTFGPGPGMLIKPDVIEQFITNQEKKWGRGVRIFFSPHGKKLTQNTFQDIVTAIEQTEQKHCLLIAARYEGIDARAEQEYADFVLSLGQFVLMGGDIPALSVLEGTTRLIPGVLGNIKSYQRDSFAGPLVDHPEFTQPVVWHDKNVPEIIRSGNHKEIEQWREKQAIHRTIEHHFDWLRNTPLSPELKKTIFAEIPSHYIGLLHNDIIVDTNGRVGNTSITTTDIHDIARSSKTFGVKHFFLISNLIDQQKIAQTLLDFWHEGFGVAYNQGRHQALKQTSIIDTLERTVKKIEEIERQKPVLVVTSARNTDTQAISIGYHDQHLLWQTKRPVLLLFGTGKGLAKSVLDQADYILEPIYGFTDFNHLSVRSAVAVVLDRLLGLYNQKTSE
jgi:tRNA (guanine37-N1)-methyltransferase